ncbi:MAG: BatA domain-containing protein, partial [Planctomycetota bacterium]
MSLLEPFFANPLLAAAGAACAAAPVLIHLLNRLRFRRVKFAAMAFLLESDERNRRRLLLEQILLLAARVLLVLLIAALLGRLLVDPATLAIVGQESPTHHVYLIDDSASMRASSDDAGTVFGLAEAVVRRDLELIGKRAAADTVTVLTASAATDGDAILSDRRVEPAAMAELESAFATLEAGYGSPPLPAAVAAAAARLTQGDGRGRRLVVVTDFRAVDWGDRGGPLSAVTEAEAEGVSAEIVAVGSAPGPNLAVTAVRGDFGSLAADVPVRIAVAVTNRSAVAADDVTVSVFKDADRLPVMGTVERIGPGETAEAFLDMAFPAGDASTLRFEIEADEFRPDDTFRVGISVPETRSVLIVDGSP